jgi:hypothetical protein
VSDRDTLTQSPAPTLECLHAFALRSSDYPQRVLKTIL